MTNTKRKGLSLICFIMVLSVLISGNVYAASEPVIMTSNNSEEEISELFKEISGNFFSNPEKYHALNKQKIDVSESFYNKYINHFNAGNYEILWKAFKNELSAFHWKNETVKTMQTRSLLFLTASESFYALGETEDNMPGKTFEILYTISGDYTLNDETSEIIDAEDAVLDVEYSGEGALFTVTTQNVSTNTTINSARDTVTFSASFYSDISFEDPWLGITLWTERTGPYGDSVVSRH